MGCTPSRMKSPLIVDPLQKGSSNLLEIPTKNDVAKVEELSHADAAQKDSDLILPGSADKTNFATRNNQSTSSQQLGNSEPKLILHEAPVDGSPSKESQQNPLAPHESHESHKPNEMHKSHESNVSHKSHEVHGSPKQEIAEVDAMAAGRLQAALRAQIARKNVQSSMDAPHRKGRSTSNDNIKSGLSPKGSAKLIPSSPQSSQVRRHDTDAGSMISNSGGASEAESASVDRMAA
eukprot:TRINITY_DN3527_c0_g1_i2.p1 TRINITY_DN3527_c0_g1~~TRINITY_DN3527_c0_g1_i2.p1  ORF type:complete len:235 (+),score=66.13 TRINITY_DN3527_c0_g1_i2:94-798(+)